MTAQGSLLIVLNMSDTEKSQNEIFEVHREKAIKQLEYNYAHSHLSLIEFERRLEKAVHTADSEVLNELCSDLQNIPVKEGDPGKSFLNTGSVREEESFTGILSGFKRKGKWKPARNNKILVLLGGVDLDFSHAELAPGITNFEFFCLAGGLDLIVPPGINVEVSGIPILGGIDNKLPGDHYPGQPTIRLNGFVLLGGVDIKPPKKRKKRKKS